MKRFNITVNGKAYDVAVEELGAGAAPVAAAPVAAPAAAPASNNLASLSLAWHAFAERFLYSAS